MLILYVKNIEICTFNDLCFFVETIKAQSWQFAQQGGGTSGDEGYGVAVDHAGNIYITGQFEGTAIFGIDTLIGIGGKDVFTVKYDPIGNVVYAKSAGSFGLDRGVAIAVDGLGNAYVTGRGISSYFFCN